MTNDEVSTRYRKKPVIINAMRFCGEGSAQKIIDWAASFNVSIEKAYGGQLCLSIPTLEGRMYANLGDFIIKGIAGEFYPCKPEIFKSTYEPIEEN
jgi:hypothetical protein